MPWLGLAIGAGAGLLKSELVDQPKEERQRKLAAATQRYSPWTGLKAGDIQTADPFSGMLNYGAQGAMLDQNIENSQADNNWMNAKTKALNAGSIAPATNLASAVPNYTSSSPTNFYGGPSKLIF